MLNTCMAGAGGGLGFFGDRLSGGGIPPVEAEERAQSAQRMLSHAGHRILLVLDRVRDSRAEMAALQCADYLGVRRAWRVEAPQDGEEADDTDVSETSESAPTMRSMFNQRLDCLLRHAIYKPAVTFPVTPALHQTIPNRQANGGNSARNGPGNWNPVNMQVKTFHSVEALLQQLQQTMMPIWVMSNTTPWPAHKLGKQKKKMPMAPPPLPLDSPQLPTPPPMLALVLGDIGAEHSPSAFMMQQADVRVCLPVSSRFTDGRSLPLPGAVALALQALLQKYPSEDDELNSTYDPHNPRELRTPPRTAMQDPMCQASSHSCCFFNKGSGR